MDIYNYELITAIKEQKTARDPLVNRTVKKS